MQQVCEREGEGSSMNSRVSNLITIVSYLTLYIVVRTTLYIDLGWAVTGRLQVNNHDNN